MAAPKKSPTKARPKAAKKTPAKHRPAAKTKTTAAKRTKAPAAKKKVAAKRAPVANASRAKTRPDRRAAARAKKSVTLRSTSPKKRGLAAATKGKSHPVRPARVPPLRRPLTGTPVPNRLRRGRPGPEDRQTPLANRVPVEVVPEVAGFRPSRILTTRPRPVIRQVDPTGGEQPAPRTLHPWEIEVDDLAELMAARAAEEKAAEELNAHFVTTTESAEARIAEVRDAGWMDDLRPSNGLSDARVRLVHDRCKFIDGKAVRDVSLSVHPPSGRATLSIEGGPRLRTASFRMREDEQLPLQLAKLLDDPARFARAEHASGQDLMAQLEEIDRAAVSDLRMLARDELDPDAVGNRLRAYVAACAATHAAFGLPATVDAIWDRFGVRRACVLERLDLDEQSRRLVADAFDGALDSL